MDTHTQSQRWFEPYKQKISELSGDNAGFEALLKASILIERYNNAIAQGRSQGGHQDRTIVDLRNIGKEVIVIGDIHGRIDNLEKIIEHSELDRKLELGTVVVVFLGDLIHSEDPDTLDETQSSWEVLERVMVLKSQYPTGIYTLLGNHDFLRNGVTKGGVPQNVLFDLHIRDHYGEAVRKRYIDAIEQSPLMAIGDGFVLVHAGPIHRAQSLNEVYETSIKDVANDRQGQIVQCATWARWHSGPDAYSAPEVNEFLRLCGQPNGQLIVGHTPFDRDNFHWELTPNHHIVHAATARPGYASILQGTISYLDADMAMHSSVKQMTEYTLDPGNKIALQYGDNPIMLKIAGGYEVTVMHWEDLVSTRQQVLGSLNRHIEYYLVVPEEAEKQFKALRRDDLIVFGSNKSASERFKMPPTVAKQEFLLERSGEGRNATIHITNIASAAMKIRGGDIVR